MATVAAIREDALPQEEVLRADLYGMLGALLARPPSVDLLARIAKLEGDGTPLGQGIGALATMASHLRPGSIEEEFNTLFIGLTRGELLPYASYYMTGFLHEKPLAALRRDMARLGIERARNVFEPEDSMASLCEMMAGLIRGDFGPGGLRPQKDFFNAHVVLWAEHFFTDLEGAKASIFYAPVGSIGRAFVGIEREAFRMGA